MSSTCHHEENDVQILSITPAAAGWAFATLLGSTRSGSADPDLEIVEIIAWALVRLQTRCDCPPTMVVPMTAAWYRLAPQLGRPYATDDHYYDARVVPPGMRPVLSRGNTRFRLELKKGDWTDSEGAR